jgi:hypothetical protein
VERNGDFEAFGAGHGRRLIHLAEPLLGDWGAAEDLTRDVLARAYLRWDRVERDDPYAYVRRALINARIDRWRRRLPIPVADLGPDRVVADHAQGVADREHLFAALRLVIHGKHLPAETVRSGLSRAGRSITCGCRSPSLTRVPGTSGSSPTTATAPSSTSSASAERSVSR